MLVLNVIKLMAVMLLPALLSALVLHVAIVVFAFIIEYSILLPFLLSLFVRFDPNSVFSLKSVVFP